MDCRQARRLLRHSIVPGAGPGRNAHLGFHLSACAACRAYRLQLQPNGNEAEAQPPSSRLTVAVRFVIAAVLTLLLGLVVYFGVPLARAWHDLSAMSNLPSTPANRGVVTPSAAVPTKTPPTAQIRQVVIQPSPALAPPATAALARTRTSTPAPSVTATTGPTLTPTAAPSAAPPPTPTLEPPSAVTVLLLGIDARPGEGTRGRSDSIILLRLDPARQQATCLSLPRDLWVDIPGAGQGKINSAYAIGEQQGQGAQLASQTISKLLGIPIDYTVVIDFAGFRSLIDTLGGVPVDVPKELYDAQFPTDDYGYTVAHFLPGTEVMYGDRALMFSRIRHPDSDFERMRRQQLVLLGIARKLRERGTLQNLREADALTSALRPFVRTDLPPALSLRLLWSMRNLDPNSVYRVVADGSILSEANIGGAYALTASSSTMHTLGAQLLAAYGPSGATP